MKINFDVDGIDMPSLDLDMLRAWIVRVADSHGLDVGRINYLFCDDEQMLESNRKYLGHDYYTDIITFDYSVSAVVDDKGDIVRRGRINGDIIISIDTVNSNADGLGVDRATELHRVIIHGVLHLCGINDKCPGEREIMEANEDAALSLLKTGL